MTGTATSSSPSPSRRGAARGPAARGDREHRQREGREHDVRRGEVRRRTPAATTPRPPEPYSGQRPSPRSTSAADDGPAMPCDVSELSTTVAPAPRASADGMIQYSETATPSTAQRATTASARRHDHRAGPARHHDRHRDELQQRHDAGVHPGHRRERQREPGRPPPAGPAAGAVGDPQRVHEAEQLPGQQRPRQQDRLRRAGDDHVRVGDERGAGDQRPARATPGDPAPLAGRSAR